jgi:hypothetical protein
VKELLIQAPLFWGARQGWQEAKRQAAGAKQFEITF